MFKKYYKVAYAPNTENDLINLLQQNMPYVIWQNIVWEPYCKQDIAKNEFHNFRTTFKPEYEKVLVVPYQSYWSKKYLTIIFAKPAPIETFKIVHYGK